MRISKSKRLWISIITLLVNLVIITICIFKAYENVVEVAKAITIVETPILIYVLGETFRPSGKKFKLTQDDTKE